MLLNEWLKFARGENRLFDLFVSLPLRVDIEGSDNFEAFLFESAIGEECQPKITDPDHNDGLELFCAQHVTDHVCELGDVIA